MSRVPDKSKNSYKINLKKTPFFGPNMDFKVKNRPVNKDQEVRDQVSTTFTEAPNSGLTVGENLLL